MPSPWLLALLPVAKKLFSSKDGERPEKHHSSWNPFHRERPMRNYFQPSYYIPKRSIHHRHLVIFILFWVMIFLIILLCGCSSSAAKQANLYIVELKYDAFGQSEDTGPGIINGTIYKTFNNEVKDLKTKIRIGYFGICGVKDEDDDWVCGDSVNNMIKDMKLDKDPFNLLNLAFQLKSSTLSPWVMIIGTVLIFFTCVALIMSHSAQTMSLPLATFLNVASAVFMIIGMVWQQVGANSIQNSVSNITAFSVVGNIGTPNAGLGWASALFVTMCACGMGIILVNEKRIEAQTGELGGVARGGGSVPPGAGMPPDPMIERYPSHHHSILGRGRSESRHTHRNGLEPEYAMPSPHMY